MANSPTFSANKTVSTSINCCIGFLLSNIKNIYSVQLGQQLRLVSISHSKIDKVMFAWQWSAGDSQDSEHIILRLAIDSQLSDRLHISFAQDCLAALVRQLSHNSHPVAMEFCRMFSGYVEVYLNQPTGLSEHNWSLVIYMCNYFPTRVDQLLLDHIYCLMNRQQRDTIWPELMAVIPRHLQCMAGIPNQRTVNILIRPPKRLL